MTEIETANPLRLLSQRVDRLAGFDSLLSSLATPNGRGQVEGLTGAAKALFLARLLQRRQGPCLVITYQAEQAQRLLDDLRQFGFPADSLHFLPALESRWFADAMTDHLAVGERIAALGALASGSPVVVIGTAEAVFQRTSPPQSLLERIALHAGQDLELSDLLPRLVEMGYESETTISRPGQFSRRGGILDIFASAAERPVRIELFGDEIERMRYFDVSTQRSVEECEEAVIGPARELRLTTENVNEAAQSIRAALARRVQELTRAGAREALDTLTRRVEDDLSRLQNGVYFDGMEEYFAHLVPQPICALDYLGRHGVQRFGYSGVLAPDPQLPIPEHPNTRTPEHPNTRIPEYPNTRTPDYPGTHHSLVVIDEPGQIRAHWERLRGELADSRNRRWERGELLEGGEHSGVCEDGFERAPAEFTTLVLTQLPRVYEGFPPGRRITVSTAPMESFRARLQSFADEVQTWAANGAECLVVSDQAQRVREICAELGLGTVHEMAQELSLPDGDSSPPESNRTSDFESRKSAGPAAVSLTVLEGRLRQGFKFADAGLYVATDAELFGSARAAAAGGRRRVRGGIPISTILDLRENDYVVHVTHGIGVYRGLVKRRVEDADRDFLYIQYAGGDGLYVPADQIDRIQRYVGGEGAPPAVNRIGGNDWQRTTRRVKEQAREMAQELIELYAARQRAERPSFGPDTPWQAEMEDAFPYDETPSQLRAIRDCKADLEEEKPMDRLVCGDVGFGKTEVAIRAAFKVAEAGKQVAVLCPTTVLAAQHHTTFSERLAAYPITVELLSRFRSRQEQKKTIDKLKAGAVDIVVGTHRLLSKDVEFRNVGLIVVDEEQRFGVAHKERLKQLRKTVDVLTLTATPIPRTLSMALSGLRDMSVIEDPPAGRLAISTVVREYDEDLVRDAILRELERDGQVYFVHNRIESIDYVAERIRRLVPEARMRVGHGQMSEDELESIMHEFYHREYDILLCTTIIENGLDIPNVNTIVVDRADRMGLAQLYQLRGRVGRSNRQAYAYLLYRPHKQLTEAAEQRLVAIREFTSLGSGFQIAMRDLEIRGAGNLLGSEQSGAMVSVGFDLYCQLLAQAVAEARGEEPVEDVLPPVDLSITAHIPNEYIPNEAERIYFYKKMSGVRSGDDIAGLQEELEDRFGDPPRAVWNALAVLRLRLRAREAGIAGIRGERREVSIRLAGHARLSADAIKLLTYAFKGHRFTADSVVVPLTSPRILEDVEEMVKVVERAVNFSRTGDKRALVG